MHTIIVPSEGPKECLMCLVGEAPGADEVAEGKPFCGMSGKLLNQKLHLAGISRTDCYVTNVVKTRPSSNDFSIYWRGIYPTKELMEWRDKLLNELYEVKTNIIVALGANALWALTGKTQIGKWRGSLLQVYIQHPDRLGPTKTFKVIGAYHPAAALREPTFGFVLGIDLKKALRESSSPELCIPERNLWIRPTLMDIAHLTKESYSASEIAFDIETAYGTITCISFSFDKSKGISIPLTLSYWGHELRYILKMVRNILCETNALKVGQNMSYDIQYLARILGIFPKKPWFDTMVAQHSCYSELPKGLAFLASVYTNEPYYKDDFKTWNTDKTNNEVLWEYNARDAAVTLECSHSLKSEIQECGAKDTFDFSMRLLEPLLYMMLKGIRVDQNAIKTHRTLYDQKIQELEAKFKSKFGDVNPRSPKQMQELAYKTLKLKPVMKKGRPTADAKALEKLSIHSPDIAIAAQIRSEKTIVSNFLEMEVDKVDGRLRCSFNATGTETRRLSSSESVWGTGRNLQNIPKKVRDIFVPDEGKIFIEADLAGAESRVVAYMSCDPGSIKIFETPEANIHTYTACFVFDMTPDSVKEDKGICEAEGRDTEHKYFISKKLRHSIEKAGSWVTVSEQLKIPAHEAKRLVKKFYQNNPNLIHWFYEVEAQLKKNRTITTPFGDKRIFMGRLGTSVMNRDGIISWCDITKQAVAHIAQDVVGKVINTGICNIYEDLCVKVPDVELLLQVHDSVLLQCNIENEERVRRFLPGLLDMDIPYKLGTFKIPIEVKSGYNWRDMR